ncbi:MAG: DUF2911 domain-containing protein [Acidobacteriota bacterium]
MKRRLPVLAVIAIALAAMVATDLFAQDLHPTRRKSPMGQARVTLDNGTYVSVIYSRPYVRGREVFGEGDDALVPFGKVWRTGANEATELTTTGDIKVGGKTLPAGTYSVFTVPGTDSWTIHFNSQLGMWGTGVLYVEDGRRGWKPTFDTADDVAVAEGKVSKLDEPADPFTISFETVDDGVHMVLSWSDTEVRTPVEPAG